jgi:acyl carrier protein
MSTDQLSATDKLREAFVQALNLTPDVDVEQLAIGQNANWDSIAHMALVAELEAYFGVMLETEDLIEMSSYEKAVEILQRYGVAV